MLRGGEGYCAGRGNVPSRRPLQLLGALIVVMALGAIAATASAHAKATASIMDPPDDNGSSFETAPTDLHRLDVMWDGAMLHLSATYAAPAFQSLRVLIASEAHPKNEDACDPDSVALLELRATSTQGHLSAPEVDGALVAEGSWSGNTITFAFSSPVLSRTLTDADPFVCVSGATDGDRFIGAFAGRILRITPANATDALKVLLGRRYGTSFSEARRVWLKCPREEIFPETDDAWPWVYCRFEFGLGQQRVRSGGVTFELLNGILVRTYYRDQVFSKALRRCRIPTTKRSGARRIVFSNRQLRASGYFGRRTCRYLVGPAGMGGDIEYFVSSRYPRRLPRRFRAHVHGTNTGGFGAAAAFPCRVSRLGNRYRFACENKLGDRFVYALTVTQGPKPRPKRRPSSSPGGGPSCDAGYSGACLKPGVGDYDCAGGSGNGPNYVDGPIQVIGNDPHDLDSDGDGIACES